MPPLPRLDLDSLEQSGLHPLPAAPSCFTSYSHPCSFRSSIAISCRRSLHESTRRSPCAASVIACSLSSFSCRRTAASSLCLLSLLLLLQTHCSTRFPASLSITGLAQQFLPVLASQQSHSAKLLVSYTLKQLSGLRSKPVSPGLPSPGAQTRAHSHARLALFATRLAAPHTGPPRASSGQTMRKHHIENVLAKKYTNRSSATLLAL